LPDKNPIIFSFIFNYNEQLIELRENRQWRIIRHAVAIHKPGAEILAKDILAKELQ